MMKKLGKKDKIQLIITVFSIIIFIVLTVLFPKRKALRPVAARASQGIFSATPRFKHDPRRNKGIAFLWEKGVGDKEVKRNPFSYGSPGNSQAVSLSNLSLKGILWNPDKPSAVINEHVLGIGDMIGNFKVTQITQDRVILENEGSKLELKLNQ